MAKVEAAKTAAAEKKDKQDDEQKAADAEKMAKQDADEAEKMGQQDEAATASVEAPKSMTLID